MSAFSLGRVEAAALVAAWPCFALSLLALAGPRAVADEPGGAYSVYQQLAGRRAVCGNNGLYTLVRMQGWDVTYDMLQAAIGGDSLDGKSLLEIRRACERMGIPAVVLKSPIEELPRYRFPVLAYGTPGRPLSGPRAGQKHFVVLLGLEDGHLKFIDPTTTEIYQASLEWLLGQGGDFYCLEVARSRPALAGALSSALPAVLVAACFLAALLYLRRRVFRPAGPLIAALIVLALSHPEVRAGDDGPSPGREPSATCADASGRVWRRPGCDGVNSLYLFLRAHGADARYEEVSRKLGGGDKACSLRDLRDVAREAGIEAVVADMDYRTLSGGPLPAIALLDSDRGKGSYLVLVCGASPDEVDYFDGGFASWNKVDTEVFLRKWRGFAIVKRAAAGASPPPLLTWSFAGLVACGYLFMRIRGRLGRTGRAVPGRSPEPSVARVEGRPSLIGESPEGFA